MATLTITMTTKAFSTEPRQEYQVRVQLNCYRWEYEVWDSIAKQFTSCHSLCANAKRRARKAWNDRISA